MIRSTTTDSQSALHDEAEPNKQTKPNRFSYWVTTLSFLIALSLFVLTPLLAIQWSRVPFPGFVIEQSGVVANIGSQGWSGREAGIDYPQRITSFADQPVPQPEALKAILETFEPGQEANAQTVEPNGLTRSYTSVEIMSYPLRDLMKFFWLPYFIGFVYLLIGGGIYILRGFTRAGLSFAFFCAWTSIVCALSFDLSTTHQGTALWTLAIAMLGGAISGLAFLFPNEIEPLHQRSWLRIFTYIISAGLTLWGWLALNDTTDAWAYITPWRMSFLYAGFSLLLLFVMLFFRLRRHPSSVERQQIRIILFGSLIGFVVICGWLIAPVLNVFKAWDPVLFLPLILFFPLSVGVAILRYRLWAFDLIIRRTLVYGILTGTLGLIFFVSIVILTEIFKIVTGETSSLVTVISTLIIAALFSPLRRRVQNVIDRRLYRNKYHAEKALVAFAAIARDEVDIEILKKEVLQLVQQTLQPEQIGLWLKDEEHKS